MDLHKLIKDSRENLRDNTIKTYVFAIKRLNGGVVPESIDFLLNLTEIRAKIGDMKLSTRRSMLTAIMVVLSAMDGLKYAEAREQYRLELGKLNTEYDKYVEGHVKSLKEEKNWVSVKQLEAVLKIYMKEIRRLKLNKAEIQEKPNKMVILKAVVAGLYVLFSKNDGPRRLEYAGMKVIRKRSEIRPNVNYLLVTSARTKHFIFQTYKTSSNYGVVEKKVPNKLNTIINIWLKYNKTDNFLVNSKGTAMSANSLGKFITDVFSPLDKKITLNLIRHIYISENVNLTTIKDNSALASNMGHSVALQEDYIKNN